VPVEMGCFIWQAVLSSPDVFLISALYLRIWYRDFLNDACTKHGAIRLGDKTALKRSEFR